MNENVDMKLKKSTYHRNYVSFLYQSDRFEKEHHKNIMQKSIDASKTKVKHH